MTKSLLILEDCAETIEDYEEIIVEVEHRFRNGSLDKLARDAILKRVEEKLKALSEE